MDCTAARHWLLEAERPHDLVAAPAELAAHLSECPDCQRQRLRLANLERAWREQPLPATADRSREAFLRRTTAAEAVTPRNAKRSWFVSARWVVAATVLITAGVSLWLVSEGQQVRADSDVLDRLIDWNLQISEGSAAEREQLFARLGPTLQADLNKSALRGGDRDLAQTLLTNGAWLATNVEPLETADRFDAVADQLLARLQLAARKRDAKGVEKLARNYARVAARGIDAKLEKVKTVEGEPKKKLDKILERDARRLRELEELQTLMPGATQKELNKILEQAHKKQKSKSSAKNAKQNGGK